MLIYLGQVKYWTARIIIEDTTTGAPRALSESIMGYYELNIEPV